MIGLLKQIRLRTIDNLLVQSRIAANPHLEQTEAREFIEGLVNERRQITGFEREHDVIDHDGLARLKATMAEGRAVKVR